MLDLELSLKFVVEIDKLKSVLRRTTLTDGSRYENTAEHSWHITLMAVLLADHGPEDLDLMRAVKMLLVHDIVEIDAGDTFCYDEVGSQDKAEREERAAERLFGMRPEAQAREVRELWQEFEARESPEARFANAMDRAQPILQNLETRGHSWQQHGIRLGQVLERNRPIEDGAPGLWRLLRRRLEEAVEEGWLAR